MNDMTGVSFDVVDTQVHLHRLGGLDAGIAAMDAVGIRAVIIDEAWGYDANGTRLPHHRRANGAIRHEFPYSTDAVARHPDRFRYIFWIERNDPEIESVVEGVRDHPWQVCLRVTVFGELNDHAALRAGEYDRIFDSAERNGVPVLFSLPKVPLSERISLIELTAQKFPAAQIIVNHCGLLPLCDSDLAANLGTAQSLNLPLRLAPLHNIIIKWDHAPLLSAFGYPYADVLTHLRTHLDTFGSDRLIWASDHTQTKHRVTWIDSLNYISNSSLFTLDEKVALLAGNARRIFNWPKE